MAQSFAFAVFATLICQINSVFPCKDTKAAKSCAFCVILLVPNSWIVMPVFCGTELRFGIEIPLIYATAECQNLRIRLVPNSWIVMPVFCGTELWFVTQSFAFAVFATLICQINSVFPCKDTKAAKSCAFCVIRLVPNSWDSYAGFLWHRAGLTQNTNFQLYISYTQPAKRRKV